MLVHTGRLWLGSGVRIGSKGSLRTGCRWVSTRSKLLRVSEEVQDALATGKPVVALETTIYTHGFPYPENVALASHLESLVRVNGGVPATIGILQGQAHVGMDAEQLIQLISTAGHKDTWKLSRRDLGFIGGFGLRGQKFNGGTTIAGTMILAHLAGIKIFATGGLGGVHRGGENSMDVSADLTELGRTPVAVISSGCKSFLDIPRTLEYLETQGVGVGTFADGRKGQVDFPAFFSRDSGVKSPQVIETEADAAAIVRAQFQLPIHSGLLFANPVPEEAAMSKTEIDSIIVQAVAEAEEKGIGGSANTPYILKRIRELSNGGSVDTNKALIEANVIRGTKVAVELVKLEIADREGAWSGSDERSTVQVLPFTGPGSLSKLDTASVSEPLVSQSQTKQADLLVTGSLASDTICDYTPFEGATATTSPTLQTSNPARIAQSTGGVGRNVATAAHYAGAKVTLASVVADDIAGSSLLDQLNKSGLTTSAIRQLSVADGARTAQYVAVNDVQKDLVMAMADMSILARPELELLDHWTSIISATKPRWVVMDANWSAPILSSILKAANEARIPVAFEPVSTAKAARLFSPENTFMTSTSTFPQHTISLATPNELELHAMYTAAQTSGLFQSQSWWETVNNFNLSPMGSRPQLVYITQNPDLVDQGIPQQTIKLLPYIPTIITKLGSRGCLLTTLLSSNDPRLSSPEAAPYILSRSASPSSSSDTFGGIYMRLFPPAASIPQAETVSVNGVGDTLLGVLMAGVIKRLARGQDTPAWEDVIPLAQSAAVMTLKSREAVSEQVRQISWDV